jgi:hypothetical protein
MNFQLKLFPWPDPGPHVIALVRGRIDTDSLKQIFRKVAEMSGPLPHGKILIDLVDAAYALEFAEIDDLIKVAGSDRWATSARIAIVSARDISQYDYLQKFSALLSNRGMNVAAFCSLKPAVDWLVGDS